MRSGTALDSPDQGQREAARRRKKRKHEPPATRCSVTLTAVTRYSKILFDFLPDCTVGVDILEQVRGPFPLPIVSTLPANEHQ